MDVAPLDLLYMMLGYDTNTQSTEKTKQAKEREREAGQGWKGKNLSKGVT